MPGTAGRVIVLLLVLGAGAEGSPGSDVQIAQDVREHLRAHQDFTIFDSVQAEVAGGRVTLRGRVTHPHKRESLGAAARAVHGVRGVDNRLEVLPVSVRDERLRGDIARGIYGNVAFRAYASMARPPIHIVVEHGHVTLEGHVRTSVDRSLAESIAGAFDVATLRNELRAGPPADR